jgi:MFS family permease
MAGSCLPILGAVLIAPVLPRIKEHFQSTPGVATLVPVALTVPALALAILAPFAGAVVDRLGRKRLLVSASVVYALFGTAPLWLDSLGAIVASRALVGVAEAAIMTCCTTLIGDYWSGQARSRLLALQTMCASASATAFFVIGGAVGSAGWRAPFWVYAASLLLAPLLALGLPTPAPSAAPTATRADSRPFPWRVLAGPCLLTFFGAVVFYAVPVEMSFLLDHTGVTSTPEIGLATAAASAATVIGAITFSRLAVRAEGLLPTTLGLCAIGFAVISVATTTPVLVAGAVLNCLGTGMLLPTLLTRTMGLLEFADRGRGTGLWNSAFFLGEFLCPVALIAATSAVGSLTHAVGLLALATAAVACAMLLVHRRKPASAVAATATTCE